MSQDSEEIQESLRACEELSKYLTDEELDDVPLDEIYQIAYENSKKKDASEEMPEPQSNVLTDEEENFSIDHLQTVETGKSETVDEQYHDRHPLLRALVGTLICVFAALLLSFGITKFVAYHTSVEGSSMEPALSNTDQVVIEKMSYYFHDPERFDVIVFPFDENVSYIKRVIGLPGESLQIQDGYVYINGKKLDDPYGNERMEDAGVANEEIVLGENEYFVLGDNRNASVDSRKVDVGVVHRDKIQGKAWLRFWPLKHFGTVK